MLQSRPWVPQAAEHYIQELARRYASQDADTNERELLTLTKENQRLRHQLAQAHTIIDVQKKLCTLLGLPTADAPDGSF